MRFVLAALVALLASPVLAQSAIPFRDIIVGTIEDYARPNFANFADDSATLRDDVATLCATPSTETLMSARDAFKASVISFSKVEFLRMGALGLEDRLERLLFWPDSKGIALRQVQVAIASADPTTTTPDSLRGKSVALQGLGAVEFLLFGTGSDDLATSAGAFRCAYASAATTLISGLAKTISDEWNDPSGQASDEMLNPQSTSVYYRSELEVLNKIAATLTFGNDTIRDQRLAPILSLTTGSPKPKSALFWRSGMTAKALEANFEGLEALFRAGKFDKALGTTNAWISSGIAFEFQTAIKASQEVPDSMEAAVASPEGMLGLKQMYVSTGSLDTLDSSLATSLGLSAGFSSLDGD